MATKEKTQAAPAKAAAKTAGTAVAVKKPGGNVVSIQAALAAQVAANANRTAPPTGSKIRCTQGKQFVLPNGQKTAGPITACILDFGTTHDYYAGVYDAKNPESPICFAIGTDPKNMTPHPTSPELQCDNCQSCPMNQFKSAANGKGKACKNGRNLALLPATDDGQDVDHEADIWTMDVSPTALKAFDSFVGDLARQFGMPPVSFLVDIAFNPEFDYPQLTFSNPRPIVSVGEAMARQAEAAEMLAVPPDVSGYAAKQAAKAAAPVGRAPARSRALPAR